MNYWTDNERRMARHRGQKYLCEFVYNLCEFIHNLSLSKITSYNTFTTLLLALPLSASFTWLRTKCVQLVCQTNHLSIYSLNWCMAMFVLKEVFFRFIPSRVSKFVNPHITNKRENIRVYLGVKTCEVFLCFLATGYYFPWLYCVEFSVASLYSLFYVTREFHRFLHRGWAEHSVGCKVFTLDSGFKIFRHVNNWTHWDVLISDWRTYV